MNNNIQPLTIETLKPFPLDQSLQSLPPQFKEEFASSYELVKGYTRSLESYQNVEKQLKEAVKETVGTINSIISLLEEYENNSAIIEEKVRQLDQLHKEFLSLETLQYQLLSMNYGSDFLKAKYRKLVVSSDEQSKDLISSYKKNGGDMTQFLLEFKESRKLYHSRKEKLHRWDEDRVSGFI